MMIFDHPIFIMLGFLFLWFILVVLFPISIWSFFEVFILGKYLKNK